VTFLDHSVELQATAICGCNCTRASLQQLFLTSNGQHSFNDGCLKITITALCFVVYHSWSCSSSSCSSTTACFFILRFGQPFNGHIKTAQQRTITQQYGDWYTVR